MKSVKCSTKDCDRKIEAPNDAKKLYCSIECAIYDGVMSVNSKESINDKEIQNQ
jgi:hypothetical protein